jgi:rhamnosyltransferase
MSQRLISVVIRTRNELSELIDLLEVLDRQILPEGWEKEVIVVDNESTDGTRELAEERGCKVVTITNFTHPRSMNMGCENSTGEIVVLTVGHALPWSVHWLASAINAFEDKTVAGVYCNTWYDPRPGRSTFWVRLMFIIGYWFMLLRTMRGGVAEDKSISIGVLGATNAAFRRTCWEQQNFDEKMEMGGEDTMWAGWAIEQGYKILCIRGFSVMHSHGLSLFNFLKQMKHWGRTLKEKRQPFNREELLSFRTDWHGRL